MSVIVTRPLWESTEIPTLAQLFDAAMCNPNAGMNRAGRNIGKHSKGSLSAYQNRKRQGKRMSVATFEALRQSWR